MSEHDRKQVEDLIEAASRHATIGTGDGWPWRGVVVGVGGALAHAILDLADSVRETTRSEGKQQT